MRWQDEDQHRHSIERTIELAEKNGLIKPLTHWIIESACAQLYVLGIAQLQIAINLSMIDLHDEHPQSLIQVAAQKRQSYARFKAWEADNAALVASLKAQSKG